MNKIKQAIQWWDDLDDNDFERIKLKQELTDKYFCKRDFITLNCSEIQKIWEKENQTEENIYLNRLKEQYKLLKNPKTLGYTETYQAMRLFCLDTQLLDINTIELMEYELNKKINNQAIQDSIDLDSWSK